jgi:V-type H+-transporting ATPase subunit E
MQTQIIDSATITNEMLAFIKNQGDLKLAEIKSSTDAEFNKGKDILISEEKQKLDDKFDKDLKQAEINTKIARSAELNLKRIEKMKEINVMVTKLQDEALAKLGEELKKNPKKYGELMQKLLLQGLIKLMEPSVTLRVRKCDLPVINAQLKGAIDTYKDMLIKQTLQYKDRKAETINCKVTIDEKNYLPEKYTDKDGKSHGCIGGFVLYARKNRIVCS